MTAAPRTGGPIEELLGRSGRFFTPGEFSDDLRTVTAQVETPGLGARIEEPAWQASFAGKSLRDDSGTLRFAVARGHATSEYEVDGITGATRTSNAIQRIVRFWMGPDGYGPLLDAIRRGEF